jgi:hypothetical protein
MLPIMASAEKPSGGTTAPVRTASWAAASVGELVSPPARRPAAVPGSTSSRRAPTLASANPVSAITSASTKYLSPSVFSTSKKRGPA